MTASLIMYARPELDAAHAALWQGLRARLVAKGIEAPQKLDESASEFAMWEDPALVFSQTCGMPYRTRLHPKVRLIGTPDYGLVGGCCTCAGCAQQSDGICGRAAGV